MATELGARSVEGAKRVARVGMPLAAAFGLGSNILLLAVHKWWPRIFIDRSDVALFKLTSQILVMYAFVCIEDCLSFNLGGEALQFGFGCASCVALTKTGHNQQ